VRIVQPGIASYKQYQAYIGARDLFFTLQVERFSQRVSEQSVRCFGEKRRTALFIREYRGIKISSVVPNSVDSEYYPVCSYPEDTLAF